MLLILMVYEKGKMFTLTIILAKSITRLISATYLARSITRLTSATYIKLKLQQVLNKSQSPN